MTKILGTVPLTGSISPGDTTDVFGTHDATFGVDGQRSVASHAARNAITTERRRHGMLVFTQNDSEYWSLNASPWNGTDSDWSLLEIGAGDHPDSAEFSFPTAQTQWVMDHTLGGYPTVQTMDLSRAEFEADVSYPSTSRVVVDFDVPGGVAGYGILRNSG